jgi:hypothetical protein
VTIQLLVYTLLAGYFIALSRPIDPVPFYAHCSVPLSDPECRFHGSRHTATHERLLTRSARTSVPSLRV